MPASRNGRDDVHPMQQLATHEIAEDIGIVGEDQLGHGRKGFTGFFRFHAFDFDAKLGELARHSPENRAI